MKNFHFTLKSLSYIRNFQPGKLVLIFLLTLFLGTASGFSIILLIPLLQLITGGADTESNQITNILNELAEKLGLELNLETILITYVILLSLMALLQYTKAMLDAGYQQTFIYQIRKRLFRKIIMADWDLLNNKSKTNHLQVLSKEVPNLANYFYFFLRLLTALIMTATYLGWALLVSVKFTVFITFTGVVLFIILRKFLSKAFTLGEKQVDAYNHLLKYIDDFWNTVKIAKVHSTEDFYSRKFNSASSSLLDLEYRIQKNYSLPQLIYRIVGILVLVAVVYIGYRFEMLPLTSFFILIILFARIYPQFTAINTDVNMIISNLASVKLVMQLDKDFPEPGAHFHKKPEPLQLKEEISITNLNFSFPGGEELFQNFNESIPAKQLTGIIGESGRGKTTFIDLLAGLQNPQSGEIKVDGNLLDKKNLPNWRTGIGYLPQDSFFIDGTLRENLVWDSHKEISDREINAVLKQVNANHLVNRFPNGLDEEIVNYPFHFSGGERQRLALARVLLRHPQILLLDEATSSLDSENEKIILDTLTSLKNKITIIFVTHRTSVLPWFDKVIDLNDQSSK